MRDPHILSPDAGAEPKLATYDDIAEFLHDVTARFLRGDLTQGDVKVLVSCCAEARAVAEDRSKYQAALMSLLNQAKSLPTAQRKSGDAPLHGSPYPMLVPPAVALN